MSDGGVRLRESAFKGSPEAVVTQPVHILLVDDEPAIRSCLGEALGGQGFIVSMAGSGAEALQLMVRQPVQMIVTDLKLPDLDGIALLNRVRAIDARIQGIVMTGYGTVDVAVQALKSGAADVLVKPFDPEHLVLTVTRVLELHRLRSENGLLKQTVLRASGVSLKDFELEHLHDARPTGASPGAPGPVGGELFERGIAEGERRARERMAQSVERQQAALTAAAREFDRARATLMAGAADQIADLAVAIAAKLVHGAFTQSPELVVADVREALTRVSGSTAVLIRVHVEDVPILEAARPMLMNAFEQPVSLKIEGDLAIARGGCVLETPTCFIDATIDAKLTRIGEAVKGLHEAR